MSNQSRKNKLNNVSKAKQSDEKLNCEKKKNAKPKLKSLIIFSLIVLLTSICLYFANDWRLKRMVIRPFGGQFSTEPIIPLNTWGTFRSGHYFGMKTASPQSIVTGMMWFLNRVEGNTLPIRHLCDQNDRLDKYGWTKHDFKTFGVQDIMDGNLLLQSSFLKFDKNSWKAKISAKLRYPDHTSGFSSPPISLMLYVAKESDDDLIEVVPYDKLDHDSVFQIEGNSKVTGKFRISMRVTSGNNNIVYRNFLSATSTPPLVNLKEEVLKNILIYNVENLHPNSHLFVVKGDPLEKKDKSNFILHQVVFQNAIEMEMSFESISEDNKESQQKDKASDINYEAELKKRVEGFDAEFDLKFPLKSRNFSENEQNIAKAILSNMIGGIGYFSGFADVQSELNPEPLKYGPLQLLTAVPSRSFFPRGFLWDEGFHHLLVSKWDRNLSLTIIRAWLNLMNAEGWIPREIILGEEARSRVPKEYIVQKNTNANPPSLLLALERIINTGAVDIDILKQIFSRLEVWFKWFNVSQEGKFDNTYRWRGRDANTVRELNPKTMASGLDDYPRASHPNDEEIHLDLRCWIAFASNVMAKIAKTIGHPSQVHYEKTHQILSDNILLDELHWSDKDEMYFDKGLHSTNIKLVNVRRQDKISKERKVISPPVYGFVPEFGYVSLFPLMLNIIDHDNPKLGKVLDHLENPELMWTRYGIRSLAKKSIFYQKYNTGDDPPYWRGAIWINANFLILRALNHYATIEGPYKIRASNIYKNLRQNIINTVITEYKRTGYIWEQYNDSTGKGQGSHPFTGWSALIVLIMSEEY